MSVTSKYEESLREHDYTASITDGVIATIYFSGFSARQRMPLKL